MIANKSGVNRFFYGCGKHNMIIKTFNVRFYYSSGYIYEKKKEKGGGGRGWRVLTKISRLVTHNNVRCRNFVKKVPYARRPKKT